MSKKTVIDVLLHPIRLRIVRAFLGEAELTARNLAAKLDDVPQATLYRHVNRLAAVGVLIVTVETPVRGAIERTYRIDPKAVRLSAKDIKAIDPETHLKYFAVFLASLLEDFGRYTRADDVNLVRDGVHYLEVPFLATPKEFASLMKEIEALIKRFGGLGPAKNRTPRTLSIITLPDRSTKSK